MKLAEAPGTQTDRIRQSYDAVYHTEKAGLPELTLGRWPRNRWDGLIYDCPLKAKSALEIGCGSGVVLYHIADRCDSLTGLEISPKRCETARANLKNLTTPVEIICGNLEEGIGKADGTFDLILWADVIEHVVDVFAAMKEVTRLLAPGGMLVTSTPNMAYIRYRTALLLGRFPGTAAKDEGFAVRPGEMYDGGHLHYFTIDVLKKLYRMNGINPIRTTGFGRLGKLHNLWPSLLSGTAQVVGIKK